MRLFFIKPIDPQQIHFWLLFEIILLCGNLLLFIGFVILTIRVRLHVNLKIFGLFMITQYFPCIFSRIIIIGYESEVLELEGSPEDSILLILCSCFRCYYFSLAGTVIFWFSIERQLAMFFIEDYESKPRKWIPCVLMVTAAMTAIVSSIAYAFESVFWYPMASVGFTLNLVGFYFYFHSYRRTKHIVTSLKKHEKISRHRYTLSLRFQLEENLWCAQVLRNAFITLVTMGVLTVIIFIIATLDISQQYFGEAATQLLTCVSNTLIAADGPIIAMGTVAYNEHLRRIVKSMFCKTQVEQVPEPDPGQVYFINLKEQWKVTEELENGTAKMRIYSST